MTTLAELVARLMAQYTRRRPDASESELSLARRLYRAVLEDVEDVG